MKLISQSAVLSVLLLATNVAACQTAAPQGHASAPDAGIRYSTGDGLSKETAIVISGATDTRAGIEAEYRWIETHLPGTTIESQSLVMGPKPLDAFTVKLPSGETRKVYFDISAFFGKL